MATKTATVNSVDHALRLMTQLAEAGEAQNVSDLARALDLPRPTLYRLLATLQEHGIVVRDGTRYRLGLRLLELGATVLSAASLQSVCLPFLTELVERIQETAHFAVLDGVQAGYIAKVDSPHPIRMASRVGWRGPLHATAVGKVMLAWSGPDLLAQVRAQDRQPYTPHTIVDIDALAAELKTVREQGFAVDREELIEGLICVAAPVLHGARLLGAVSVSGPALRLQDAGRVASEVCEAARRIAAAL